MGTAMQNPPLGRIGLIGLGMVGRHFARHILRKNGQVTVFDLDKARVKAAVRGGAAAARSARELAAKSKIIVLSLPSPDAVRAAMLGERGILKGLQHGAVIIDASTIDPESCLAMSKAAAARGADYLDTPISGGEPGSGGTDGAKAGNISFMVGGRRTAYVRAKPILHAIGKRSFYLGGPGSGSTVKLISNHIAGLNNLVMMEGFVLGAAAGFSPETLMAVFDGTDAKSFMMTDYFAPRYRRNDFDPGFSVDLMHKDHRLAADLAQKHRVPLLFNQLGLELYQMMRARKLGQKDIIEALHFLADGAGVDIKAMHPTRGAKRRRRGGR
jgi:3-hydroxyisobutyrate dehydrogenase-like beta-hydroxyacid dehydrogenase